MQEGQLLTWTSLTTLGGASLLTFFVVQYTKVLMERWIRRLTTDVYAVLVAFLILIGAQLAMGACPADWRVYGLALANSFLVAAAAGQIHAKAINPPGTSEPEKAAESGKVARN